ncbi:hypothetical protein KEM55_004929, partial [Ascosphaera atra]
MNRDAFAGQPVVGASFKFCNVAGAFGYPELASRAFLTMGKKSNPLVENIGSKPKNKLKRQDQHVKRKKAQDAARRKERFSRKKEEAKDPKLKAERLKRNIPLTLERKRVWDDVDSDVEEGGLGVSFDVERLKKQKLEEEEEERKAAEEAKQMDGMDVDEDEAGGEDDDDIDSMIATSDEEDEEAEKETKEKKKKSKQLPAPSERATSPTMSTRSTNLNLAPEALAAKFPSLFPKDGHPTPKILITTSINSTLHDQARYLTDFFPNSVYIRRTAH